MYFSHYTLIALLFGEDFCPDYESNLRQILPIWATWAWKKKVVFLKPYREMDTTDSAAARRILVWTTACVELFQQQLVEIYVSDDLSSMWWLKSNKNSILHTEIHSVGCKWEFSLIIQQLSVSCQSAAALKKALVVEGTVYFYLYSCVCAVYDFYPVFQTPGAAAVNRKCISFCVLSVHF